MIEFNNVKIFTDNVDYAALDQLHELDKSGIFSDAPIRIMPDVHAGAGCVIGFTAPIRDRVVPFLVGVDIACGMLCAELGKIEIDFARLDKVISEKVPSGRNVGEFSEKARELISRLKCKNDLTNKNWLECSLGTLGGGNHFIEIDEDESGGKYLIVHSGSRNLGKQVAEYYQDLAVRTLRKKDYGAVIASLKAQGRASEISSTLQALKAGEEKLKEGLCYLTGENMSDYLHDVKVCTEFAMLNRATMANNISTAMGFRNVQSFTTLHNYISGDGYIRKGAISAKKGERLLIPLNMRDGCIIGVGKGNDDWNRSAPHGAGRIMSRAKAKQAISMDDFKETMSNVYSTTVTEATLDEAPFAYKPSEEIISLVKDTVDIEKIIKPVYNFKAAE